MLRSSKKRKPPRLDRQPRKFEPPPLDPHPIQSSLVRLSRTFRLIDEVFSYDAEVRPRITPCVRDERGCNS